MCLKWHQMKWVGWSSVSVEEWYGRSQTQVVDSKCQAEEFYFVLCIVRNN